MSNANGKAATPLSGQDYMLLAAARELRPEERAFVGVGIPCEAAMLAMTLLDPAPYLVFESGCLGSHPSVAPYSVADSDLATTADTVVSVAEIFNYWVQGGWINLGILGAAQIDRYGAINTTVIGDYAHPQVRLPGAGGAPTIAGFAQRTMVVTTHNRKTFVDRIDFTTTPGARFSARARSDLGLTGSGVVSVVTDVGILRAHPMTGELWLAQVHPGVDPNEVRAKTGWDLHVADELGVTAQPDARESSGLLKLRTRGQTSA